MMTSKVSPCPRCGCTIAALVVDTSDKDAPDLPVYLACVRCKTKTPHGDA